MTEYFISISIVSVCYISHVIHSKLDTKQYNQTEFQGIQRNFQSKAKKRSFISSQTYLPAHRLGFVHVHVLSIFMVYEKIVLHPELFCLMYMYP